MARARRSCSGGQLSGARGTGDAGRRRLRGGARFRPQPMAAWEAWPGQARPTPPANLPDARWNARRPWTPHCPARAWRESASPEENRPGPPLALELVDSAQLGRPQFAEDRHYKFQSRRRRRACTMQGENPLSHWSLRPLGDCLKKNHPINYKTLMVDFQSPGESFK